MGGKLGESRFVFGVANVLSSVGSLNRFNVQLAASFVRINNSYAGYVGNSGVIQRPCDFDG